MAVARILLGQGVNVVAMDYEGGTPLAWLIYAGDSTSEDLPATEANHRERGAKEVRLKGIKLAWVWVLTFLASHTFGRGS